MANYAKMRECSSNNLDIVGGLIHPECIYLIAQENAEFLYVHFYKPLLRDKGDEWQGFPLGDVGGMRQISFPEEGYAFLGCIRREGTIVYQKDPKDGGEFEIIEEYTIPKGVICDLSKIDGEIYAAATLGQVYKRITNDNWQEIASSVTGKFFTGDKYTDGFSCIDGFSSDEIYAGAMDGVLWLCDKGEWRPIDLPFNGDVEQIVCASDGNVYLNCYWKLLKGRKDNWQVIDVSKYFPPNFGILNIAWFKEDLYILPSSASAVGLFKLHDEKLLRVNVGSWMFNEDKIVLGNPLTGIKSKSSEGGVYIPGAVNSMISSDDLLMITGPGNVILFNGERWFNLFNIDRSEEELRATGTFYDPREL